MFDPHSAKDELRDEEFRLHKLNNDSAIRCKTASTKLNNSACYLVVSGTFTIDNIPAGNKQSPPDTFVMSERSCNQHLASMLSPVHGTTIVIPDCAREVLGDSEVDAIEHCGAVVSSVASAANSNGLTVLQRADELLQSEGFTLLHSPYAPGVTFWTLPRSRWSVKDKFAGLTASCTVGEVHSSGDYSACHDAEFVVYFAPARLFDDYVERDELNKRYASEKDEASYKWRHKFYKKNFPIVDRKSGNRRRSAMLLEDAKREFNSRGEVDDFDEGIDKPGWIDAWM